MQVLKQCGDDLTRANVMRQVASLNGVVVPMLLPGILDYHSSRVAPGRGQGLNGGGAASANARRKAWSLTWGRSEGSRFGLEGARNSNFSAACKSIYTEIVQ